ncbi:MAG: 50S ribosomal protein L10 [Alphaproteobacteria bacterium]|nr:50S ribosomal protein L10 [Alphaproteobacteria bacterium]
MEKAKKAEVVENLKGVFSEAGSVVVAHYSGMTVAQMSALRARMRAEGASFQVAKNRLAMRASEGTPAAGIAHLFKGPTGIAVSKDPIAASRVAVAYSKENDKLVILGGVVGDKALDVSGVKALAELPSLDELRAKIIGLLQAPATKIAGVLQAPAGQLARVLSAYANKEAA